MISKPPHALDANLVFLVDRVDAMRASYSGVELLEHADAIRAKVQGYSGTLFSPELVDVFQWAARSEAFWMTLESPHLDRLLADMDRSISAAVLPFEQVKHLARLFAEIVDAKSRFTYQHSIGVAQLARHLGQRLGLADTTLDKIEVAGLLHDLGKLRVPDEILDKPGKLDARELQVMRRHSFETYEILRGIGGFEDIALWAAYHHETPDGDGYPFHRKGQDLSIEARIIAVADVFQALAQDRPYRRAMPLDQIIEILNDMARQGRLDAGSVALATAEPEICLDSGHQGPGLTGAPGIEPRVRRGVPVAFDGPHRFPHPGLLPAGEGARARHRRDYHGMAGATAGTPCRPSMQQPGLIPEARARILCTATFFPVSRRIPVRTAGTARRAGVTHACTHRSVPSDRQPPAPGGRLALSHPTLR